MNKLLYCLQEIQSNCQSIFTENIKDTYITFTKQCKVYDKIERTLLSALTHSRRDLLNVLNFCS